MDQLHDASSSTPSRAPALTGPAEGIAYDRLRSLASAEPDGYLAGDKLLEFGSTVSKFDTALEDNAVAQGWFAERPSKVMSRWVVRGVLAAIAGGIALWLGATIPMSGLVMLGGAAIAGGIVMMGFARSMPAVTMTGSMIVAMLHAYKRTLQKTMEQARSMQQVVDQAGLACQPLTFDTAHYGKFPNVGCEYAMSVKNGKFVIFNKGQPIVGKAYGPADLLAASTYTPAPDQTAGSITKVKQ